MESKKPKTKLSLKIRILIGILATPSLLLAFMLGATIMQGDYAQISYFELIYAIAGIFAMHIALSGKRYF